MRHSRFLFPGEFEAKLRQFPYNEVYMVFWPAGAGSGVWQDAAGHITSRRPVAGYTFR